MSRAYPKNPSPEQKKKRTRDRALERALAAKYPHADGCFGREGMGWCACGATEKRKAERR